MPYKVIVWGTGFVGKMVIAELLRNPEYELVGVIGHFPEEIGKDVGVGSIRVKTLQLIGVGVQIVKLDVSLAPFDVLPALGTYARPD